MLRCHPVIEMYEKFFNLSADPFRLSPDPRFCYKHPRYVRAKAYMAYAFRRAEGFVMVTGKPGTGKTTLIGDMVDSLTGENVDVANLVSTQLAADDLLRRIGHAFGVTTPGADKSAILQQLQSRFLASHAVGRRSLLIVDEAQGLRTASMEELRLITNMQLDDRPLLQIFLVGQPELREMLHDSSMDAVHQRIIAASHLEALSEDETRAYVEHRLKVAGWQRDPAISSSVFPIIHRFSGGVPRRINLICSRLLLHSYVQQAHSIGVADARVVAGELQEEQLSTRNILRDDLFQAEDDFGEAGFVVPPTKQQNARPGRAKPAVSGNTPKDLVIPRRKASFEARDRSRQTHGISARNEQNTVVIYTGIERRHSKRRSGHERRKEIRLEIGKEDRRRNLGRRREDASQKRW